MYTKGLIHWQKELSPYSYVRVMIYPDMQTAKIEMQTWDILHENDLEETCTEAEFYEALAKAQQIITQASGIEYLTLEPQGGAYAD
jgi:hypothetical protein